MPHTEILLTLNEIRKDLKVVMDYFKFKNRLQPLISCYYSIHNNHNAHHLHIHQRKTVGHGVCKQIPAMEYLDQA